jgi:hypothetical protein
MCVYMSKLVLCFVVGVSKGQKSGGQKGAKIGASRLCVCVYVQSGKKTNAL